jgi:6,7-dimethyl-8-ribityllumazine synthase
MTSSDETTLDEGALRDLGARVGSNIEGAHDGRGMRIGVACARFNGGITQRLLEGVLEAGLRLGVDPGDLTVAWVPGAFELPLIAKRFATSGQYDAVLALGAVIRGDTGHYELVAGECARGLQDVALECEIPVVFGVLTTNTVEQALERSEEGPENKGAEALETAVEVVQVMRAAPLR